jgi:hypothetical protein
MMNDFCDEVRLSPVPRARWFRSTHLGLTPQALRFRLLRRLVDRFLVWEDLMIKEHERVVLTVSVPDQGLEAGDVGTVVHIHMDGEAYEVEFLTLDGGTVAVATLEASQVRPVSKHDITHTRELRIA